MEDKFKGGKRIKIIMEGNNVAFGVGWKILNFDLENNWLYWYLIACLKYMNSWESADLTVKKWMLGMTAIWGRLLEI